jgi:hypothetical protein
MRPEICVHIEVWMHRVKICSLDWTRIVWNRLQRTLSGSKPENLQPQPDNLKPRFAGCFGNWNLITR